MSHLFRFFMLGLHLFALLASSINHAHDVTQSKQKAPFLDKTSQQSISQNNLSQANIIASIQSTIKTLNEGNMSKNQNVIKENNSSALEKSKLPIPKDDSPVQDAVPEKISTKMMVTREDDITKVSLYFEKGTPFYAVFSHHNTYYIVLSHFSDFQVDPYDENVIKNLEKISHFDTEDGLVVKLKFKQKLYPKIHYLGEEDRVVLDFSLKSEAEDRLRDIILPPHPFAPFKVHQPNGRIALEVIDKEDRCQFWVVCASRTSGANSFLHLRHYPEFDLLDSYQGVAFLLQDDDLITNYINVNKMVEISRLKGLSLSSLRHQNVPYTPTALFNEFDEKAAPGRIIELMQIAITKALPIREYLEIIWLNIGLGKIPEAISIINRLKELSPDLSLIPAFRAMDGLSHLLMGRGAKAEEILKLLSYDAEPSFWATLGGAVKSYEMKKNTPEEWDARDVFHNSDYAYQLTKYEDKLLFLTPPLIENLLSQILQVGIQQNNMSVLKVFTASKFKPQQDQEAIGFYKLAKALVGILPGQKDSSKVLKELVDLYLNPKVASIAAFELLKFQHKEKEIGSREELAALERLRFRWRGDLLEYQVSTYLADRYVAEKQYHRALPILRKIIKYYPRNSYDDKLPQKMKDILVQYFKQDPAPPILQALSVFQEFGDIAPDNDEGDNVMILATNRLVQLKLYDEAIDIIQTYIKDKMKAINHQQERKNKLFYRIGVIYLLNQEPEQSLRVISGILDPSPELQIEVNLLKSENYRHLNNHQQAIAVLGNSMTELTHQASLHFMKEQWAEAADCYQKVIFSAGEQADKSSQDIMPTAIVNLALCFKLLKNDDELRNLKEKYASVVNGTEKQAKFEFLTSHLDNEQMQESSSKVDIADIKSLKTYMDNIKKIFP